MVLKQGYKQTEVGVIPEDWEAKEITSIAKIFGGGTPSTGVKEFWHGEIPWVAAGDVSSVKSRFVYDIVDRITEIGLASCSARIMPAGTTVIIARGATVGRMAQLREEMAFNQTCYGLLPVSGFDKDFLYYSMKYSVNSILKGLTFGTIFGTITTQSFAQWKIPFPQSISEQRTIAAALSDVDALLASLDALIAKKRLIQQGAMQELLSGKRRLPGFSGEWEYCKLGDIASIIDPHPSHRAPKEDSDGIPFVGIGDISIDGAIDFSSVRFVNRTVFDEHNLRYDLKENLIGIGRVASIGKIVRLRSDVGDFVVSPTLAVINVKHVSADMLFYSLSSTEVSDQFIKISNGSTRQSVGIIRLRNIIVRLPHTIQEQRAVANILSDMDAEIHALEQQRDKTRRIKQGMMQELLTGKTRLI